MNRDPFDTLRSRNPAPPESLPEAPMTLASRITAGRPTLRRGLAIATAAAAVVLVAGGGWLIWSRAGGGRDVVAPATTLVPETTTSLPLDQEEVPELVVYFLRDGALMPVARDLRVLNVRPLPDLGPLAIDLLLWGPGAWDAGPLPDPVAAAEAQLTTAIPEGTTLLGLTIADGVAIVDLSSEFAAASPQAIAQVVYTLTGLDGVAAAAFSIEGMPQAIGSLTSGVLTPHLESWGTPTGEPSVGREFFSMYPSDVMSDVMIEHPALGGTLRAGEAVILAGRLDAAEVTLTLTAVDGTLLWNALATPSDPAHLPPEVLEAAGGHGVWATLLAEATASDGSALDPSEIPVWLEPDVPFTDEPDLPEATTTTVPAPTTTLPAGTTPIMGHAAPWSGPGLAPDEVPAVALETWAAAENAAECALLFPADPAALADGAVLHDRYFGGGWGLAWDLPSGPGRWEPGGEYCADCGREAFGVAGTGGEPTGTEDSIWANRLEWTYGPEAGPRYSHAGYGYEGLTSGGAGEPVLAYLFIDHQGCMYNVWSFRGEEHLLALIEQLRFVEGTGGYGLGALQPFPNDMLTGCAGETARDLASFEAALANGPISLEALCALVGVPDYQTGSGLFIPAYDLADGSRLFLGYTGPRSDDLIYANLVSPDGETRDLLGK